MYGWIQQSIEALALEKFGALTWARIKEEANCADVPNGGFSRHEYYDDALTNRIVFAAAKVLEMEAAAVLEAYGDYFITWMMRAGYRTMLRYQGRHMLEFLNAMDEMHRGLKKGLPRLVPPQLSCEARGDDLVLTYVSTRGGLEPMVIGLVRGVGREVFESDYNAVITKQWTSTIEGHEVHHTIYDICCREGQVLNEVKKKTSRRSLLRTMTPSQLRLEAKNYSFFQENAVVSSAWVESLVQRVHSLATIEDAQDFAHNFDIMELTALMDTWTPHANHAFSGLFRAPLEDVSGSMPTPSLGFIRGAGGFAGLCTKMFPSMMMSKDVTCGADPLIRTSSGHGLRQVPVEVLVCAVPGFAQGGWLLRALVDTPNDDVVCSIGARAVLHVMNGMVRPRLIFNILVDMMLLVVLTVWISKPADGYSASGLFLVVLAFCKEVSERIMQFRGYKQRGWLRRKFLAGRGCLNCLAFSLYLCLFGSIAFMPRSNKEPSSTIALALFSCGTWWRFLFHLRGFETFGPKILPIIYTLKSILPFAIVLALLLLGFVYALLAMKASPEGFTPDPFIFIWQAGFLGVVESRPETWYEVWFFIFSLVVAVVMVNILVGVLSESYDLQQDNAAINFNREQAEIILDTSLCLWPCTSFKPGFWHIQALFFIQDIRSDYLWLCLPKDRSYTLSRLTNIKEHTTMQVDTVKEMLASHTADVTQQLTQMSGRLEQVELCLRKQNLSGFQRDSHLEWL